MPRKSNKSKSIPHQAKSGIPFFNFKKLERTASKQKKSRKKKLLTLSQQRKKFLLANQVGLLSIYDVDKILKDLYPGRFKDKWKLPFKLDKKNLYKLYRSNYAGMPPFNKKTVEKHYHDWVRYNYALAVKISMEEGSYSCLLRSPFFWKTLYIQNLLNQDSRKTYDDLKFEKLSYTDASKVYKTSDCVVINLYKVAESTCMPMPKWVAMRMYLRPAFRVEVEKTTRRWAEKELNSESLTNIEPLLIDMWKRNYEQGLSRLQQQYAKVKLGQTFYI